MPNANRPAAPDMLFVPMPQRRAVTPAEANQIAREVADIAAVADRLPGVTIIHNLVTDSVEYMSERGLQLLQTDMPALRALGEGYHAAFFNPADAQDNMPGIYTMLTADSPHEVVTYFQQVRTTENPEWSWYLSTSRVLLRTATDRSALLLISTACPIDPLHHVTLKVQRLLDENEFLRRHAARFATLTPRERQVLGCLAQSLSSVEMADKLHISVQTADTHRRNLRRKLEANTAFELGEYARAFDLI